MRLALAALLGALLVSCGGGSDPVRLDAGDDGRVVELDPGQQLEITLDSNATTGFRWSLVRRPPPGVLSQLSSRYEAPEDGLVGQGGTEVWTFEAGNTGEGRLELAYVRPFEPAAVEGRFAVTVRVR